MDISQIILTILGGLFFSTKILDWVFRYRIYTKRDSEKVFISDLYKLIEKYNKMGCYDYSKAITVVIESFNIEDVEKPATKYGENLLKSLDEENL